MLKWLKLIKIVMCLKLRAKFRFLGFLVSLLISRMKWYKLGFFVMKLGTQHYLVYIIVLKCLEF